MKIQYKKNFLRSKPLIIIKKRVYYQKTRKNYIKGLKYTWLRGTKSLQRKRRNIIIRKKQRRIYLMSFWRRKRQIRKKLLLSTNSNKRRRRIRNIYFKSYFNRFILTKYSYKYRRSMGIYLATKRRITSLKQEEDAFYIKTKRYNRLRLKYGSRLRISRNFQYLLSTKLRFNLATIYISHRRHNTFMTVLNHRNKLVFKTSGGNEGYTGLKRPTKMGREAVAKATAIFVKKNFKIVDIVFIKALSKHFHFLLRAFLVKRSIYVRNFINDKRRAYTLARRKKKRRI